MHIFLHFLLPLLVALIFYSEKKLSAYLIMMGTMLIDLDHLLADPIYDPERCSIGFHPLHQAPAILCYILIFAIPLWQNRNTPVSDWKPAAKFLHLAGTGLLIHMILDGLDCVI